MIHGGDKDSLNLVEHLNGLPGVDLHITDAKRDSEAVAPSLRRECDILMICGHGYRDGKRWRMGGLRRGWLRPKQLPTPLPAKLVVFDACGVSVGLLKRWHRTRGYLDAETVVAYGGGRRTKPASPTVQLKQNLVVARMIRTLIGEPDAAETDITDRSATGLRRVLEHCIAEEHPLRHVYHLFPDQQSG